MHVFVFLSSGLVSAKDEPKFSVDEIMVKAEEFLDQYNYEMAQKFCQRALDMNPDHVKALEVTASLLLEVNIYKLCSECVDFFSS